MKHLEKRMHDLEELMFGVVLQTKAEIMAIRDILIESNLVSAKRWDDMVREYQSSYSSFKVVKELEKRSTSEPLEKLVTQSPRSIEKENDPI